jgi:hypothetical protein
VGITPDILDIGPMTASRMLLPPLEICMLSCALKEILIILWRAFLAVVQFGKGQMGRLCLTAVANPSTGRGYSAESGVIIDAQVEVPGHSKGWLDGKTGSNKRYCQQCMCAINTPEVMECGKKIMSAKWLIGMEWQ